MGDVKKVGGDNGGTGLVTLVFKVELHCQGCAQKVKKNLEHLPGVESVKADHVTNQVTAVVVGGKVDPAIVKKRLEAKNKKAVDFASPPPQPPNSSTDKDAAGKKLPHETKKPQGKKPKEASAVAAAVLKTNVHCDGCAHKITKIISKCQGVEAVNVDLSKDQIVIKGTMDMKEMLPYLNLKLKRPVEVLPPPPPKKSHGDSGKKAKEDAKPAAGGGKLPAPEENVGKVENVNKMETYPYVYPYYGYGGTHVYNPHQAAEYGYVAQYGHAPPYLHAPQMFSDENPNACSVM